MTAYKSLYGATPALGDDSTPDDAALASALSTSLSNRAGVLELNGDVGNKFKLNSQLSIPEKNNIFGNGFQVDLFSTDSNGTMLKYYGTTLTGTNAFVTFGSTSGHPKIGGSLNYMGVNANQKAPIALRVTDVDFFSANMLMVEGGTNYQLEYTDTSTTGNVTAYSDLRNLYLRSENTAHALYLNGGGTGADGCTLSCFSNLRTSSYGSGSNEGHGIYLTHDGLDNSCFSNYSHFTTATTAGKGYGVYVPDEGYDGNTGFNQFPGVCNVGGGFYVGRPGAAVGWGGEFLNDVDRPTHNPVISGPGSGDIWFERSASGKKYGPARTHGLRDIHKDDDYLFFDYTSGTLRTNMGHYAIAGSSATVAAGLTDQGGVTLTPASTSGSTIYKTTHKGNLRTQGRPASQNPTRVVEFCGGPSSGWAYSTHRVGFDGSNQSWNASTLSDGVWLECASTGSPGTLYLVVTKGGVQTAAVPLIYQGTSTSVGYSSAKQQYVIEVTSEYVRVQVRGASQPFFVDCALVVETGGIIPTVGMSEFEMVSMTANFGGSMDLFSNKSAFTTK